ncbi:MAG: YhcH/YjgK/YiaL family protein, partial [Anaerolineae bacterium]|nr:YhcH/YjgK/YiaL family protein [Anaerolineae bacterium]
MIIAKIEQMADQAAYSAAMRRGMEWLVSVLGQALPDGRVDIDGDEVYALVQSYTGKPHSDQPRFEAHRRYIDVQAVVVGEEAFGWAPIEALQPTDDYSTDKDVVHGTVPMDRAVFVPLHAGEAMILYPSDAHAPGLALDEPIPVRK